MWDIVSGVTGLIVIIVMVYIYWLERRCKELSYDIISNTPLFDVHEEIEGRLQVILDGKTVEDVIYLVLVEIVNSGNIPIKTTDYESLISLNFGENAQIFTAEVYKTNPDNLKNHVNISGLKDELEPFIARLTPMNESESIDNMNRNKIVKLEPTLLNGGESITLKILGTQIADDIFVDGRIVGVKGFRKKNHKVIKNLKFFFIFIILGIVIGLTVTIIAKNICYRYSIDPEPILGVLLLIPISLLVLMLIIKSIIYIIPIIIKNWKK